MKLFEHKRGIRISSLLNESISYNIENLTYKSSEMSRDYCYSRKSLTSLVRRKYHGHFINLHGASLEIGLNKSDLVERLGAGNIVSLE